MDDESLDIPAFIEELMLIRGRPAAPPGALCFLEAYEKSEQVFVITITSQLSAAIRAKTAADMFLEEHPDRRIYVIDSRSTGPR